MNKVDGRYLYAKFTALPGAEADIAQLVADFAQTVRQEAGCLQFEPFVEQDNARSWVVFEEYVDEHAFQEHLIAAHSGAFNKSLESLVEGGKSVLHFLTPPLTESQLH